MKGDQYLVIGVGFLGQRMVHRLLERGETRVRCFDLVPTNPFEGNNNVEYVVGNVLKRDDLKSAMKGVDTVYSTFALIRFWERLAHQADISYNVNVIGTKNVLEMAEEAAVKRLVYTSSSNVASLKGISKADALLMDENIQYVSREESPNHYGWTKALAEKMALSFNRRQTDNGRQSQMSVSVIRPCSGIFGAFDRCVSHLY
jgi:nucleoside-diphosphate-sugar epimerase